MKRKNRLSPFVSVLTFLALITSTLLASNLIASDASPSQNRAYNQQQHAVYRALCELNRQWSTRSPDLNVINTDFAIASDVPLIRIHLSLALRELHDADTSRLNATQKHQRKNHLKTLQTYINAGQFPQNVFVEGRRPVFIDPCGTHCAVGHLIAMSGHASLANMINEEHQLDYLSDIRTEGLRQWQEASGFSLAELALIQPTYQHLRGTTLTYPKEVEEYLLGNSDALMSALKNGSIDVNARVGGKTILHLAAAAGDLDLVKRLLEGGADLDAVSTLGCDKTTVKRVGRWTLVSVHWNTPTVFSGKGKPGIGFNGAVYQNARSRYIANVLNDVDGGREGFNALDFAIQPPAMHGNYAYWGRQLKAYPFGAKRFGHKPNQEASTEPTPMERLTQDRAAVAKWLRQQGLQENGLQDVKQESPQ
ncbi:ankyrin repeat domain-containing protein [Rhodopirellula sp. MGV]|uniref:ankyrin repeat domain-containing protein n=1 Tax=Rhodopirellula sp. MGV TaxID=2023130 RepID=UPI000B96EB89|nr:ankyrin repeat domain-containing protein [Rhodopirellula sp. MGV]OYP35359.1 hypothetical protein CGZ80_11855 [Rhodopirellula sp. MGV]PNY37754.1 ankyrin repeat domain-containing protein [Rhodopirellula baltica]